MWQHSLANRVFKNYDDIVDSVCEALNTFTESSERVTKFHFRDWVIMPLLTS